MFTMSLAPCPEKILENSRTASEAKALLLSAYLVRAKALTHNPGLRLNFWDPTLAYPLLYFALQRSIILRCKFVLDNLSALHHKFDAL
jgi:hypothetical protein